MHRMTLGSSAAGARSESIKPRKITVPENARCRRVSMSDSPYPMEMTEPHVRGFCRRRELVGTQSQETRTAGAIPARQLNMIFSRLGNALLNQCLGHPLNRR